MIVSYLASYPAGISNGGEGDIFLGTSVIGFKGRGNIGATFPPHPPLIGVGRGPTHHIYMWRGRHHISSPPPPPPPPSVGRIQQQKLQTGVQCHRQRERGEWGGDERIKRKDE